MSQNITPDAGDGQPTITAVDLFCGAGGFSEALRQASHALGYQLQEAAINHWEPAVETHEKNHPDAHQYHSKVEQLHPPNVIEELTGDRDADVDILTGGPECTDFSRAKGGKPVSEQKRMSPWHILDWLEKLNVDAFVIENVPEIQSWGPVEDGQPVQDGSIFDAWVTVLNRLGYAVDWTELTAADYGDPTTRNRFFIVGRKTGSVTFPDRTHSPDGVGDTEEWRTAADIIDWSDRGSSIWTRDLVEPRVHTPPKDTTMERIAEGIRRHCSPTVEPYADILETLGRDEIRWLREERLVPRQFAGLVADAVDEPFLVSVPDSSRFTPAPWLLKHKKNSPAQSVEEPVHTIHANGNHFALGTAATHLLRQQDGAHPLDVATDPVPTIATKGAHAVATTELRALIEPKNGLYRGIHSNPLYPPGGKPFHTVTTDPRAKLVTPSVLRFSHGGRALSPEEPMPTIATEKGGTFALSQPVLRPFIDDYEGPPKPLDRPLGTVTSRDRFALCVPELWPWGIDVQYRMLQPQELKQAQGFPEDYEIVGTKEQQTEQIGNAVPVHLARSLIEHVLTANHPGLDRFGGGLPEDQDATVPDYEEVAADD